MIVVPENLRRGLGRAAAIALLASLAVAPGRASAQATRQGFKIDQVVVQPIGNPIYKYTFTVSTDPGFAFGFNSYFVIYDLPDIVPVSDLQPPLTNNHGEPPNWEYQEIANPGLGPYPLGTPPAGLNDNPAISNVVWSYKSATDRVSGNLGEFFVVLDHFVPGPWFVAALLLDESTGVPVAVEAVTMTPKFGDPNFIVVPEPGAVALLGIGLAGLGTAGLARRRRRAAA